MSKKEMYPIKEKMSMESLEKRIKYIEYLTKVLTRLYFIKYRYKGFSVEESAKKTGVTKRIGYIWQRRWNRDGYPGLFPKYGGGRPSKLSEEQKYELKNILREKRKWKTSDVQAIIKEKFNVDYSSKQVKVIIDSLS